MKVLIEEIVAVPSYNGCVIEETGDMAPTLDQYWSRRKEAYREAILRLRTLAKSEEAERVWQGPSRQQMPFLQQIVRDGADLAYAALIRELGWKAGFARDAKRIFLKAAKAELWIPLDQSLQRVVRVPGAGSEQDFITCPEYCGPNVEPGKAVIAIRWQQQPLFVLLSAEQFTVLDTFLLTMDQDRWNTGDIFPRAFLAAADKHRGEIQRAGQVFAKVREQWQAAENANRLEKQLNDIDRVIDLWEKVQIPEAQKLELFRRFDLFADADPAAPKGLLLKGPPGTGKSLIGTTLAETLRCHWQLLSLPDLKLVHQGDSAQQVRAVWNEARRHEPSVMLIDDCEGALTQRGSLDADKISDEIVESFLPEWQGVSEGSRILVIGISNRPHVIDTAIRSRFGWEMEIQLPHAPERAEILRQELQSVRMTCELPADIGELTQGLSGRDLGHLAASLRALDLAGDPTREDILQAIRAFRISRNSALDDRVELDELMLDEATADRVRVISAVYKDSEKWRAHGAVIPKSLLLVGPSSSDLGLIVKVIAKESGLNILTPTMAQVKATILGGSATQVSQLFERCRAMAPSILFLAGLDKLAPKQSVFDSKDRLSEEIASQLEQELNGVRSEDNQVFVVAAAADVEKIEDSVLACFAERLTIPAPSHAMRPHLLRLLLTGKNLSFPLDEGVQKLANKLDGSPVTASSLAEWVRAAERKALLRAVKLGGPEHLSIDLGDFGDPAQLVAES